jgi:hypothetical protein
MSSKAQVLSNNTNSFPNNNSGQITPQVLRDFNADFINSVQFTDTVTPSATSASFAQTAVSASFATNATNAVTASFLLGTIASASFATSASFAQTSISSSFAQTASFALNAPTIDTGSFVTTSSFNTFSGSISGRVASLEAFSSSLDATFATDAQLAAATASLSGSIASLSASYLSSSSSFASNINSLNAATASYVNASVTASSVITASANVNIITFTKGDGTTFDVTVAVSGSVLTASFAATALSASFSQTAISASFSQTAISASYALNATSASYASQAQNAVTAASATSASFSSTSISSSFSSTSTSASYASQAQNAVSSSFASTATSASFASTIASGLNITASNILVTNDLVVNGTASFGYTKTTSGSAVIIGDEFIILNADTPTAPYAGIKVYDTGSASTASFEWNGNGDYWIAVEETGQSSAFLTGASGSKGSEVFPTANRLTKGTGNNTIIDSSITDNGSTVSINSNTQVTGSLNVTAGITGSLLGTASFANNATSASFSSTATSASYAVNSTSASYAVNATSASFASNGGVTQILAGPNITVSPLSGRGQVTISSTGFGTGSFNTATGSYGSFYDTTTQTNPVANIARSMSFNETQITNGVSISGSTNPFNTYIKTENAGVYNIQFSAQIDKTDVGTDELYIWLSKNGIDLLDSAGKVTLDGGGDAAVVAWNWFVQSAANDYYQIKWSSPDTGMRILAEASSSTHPGIPSIIATVDRIDQFLSNTGSFSGSFDGVFTGSLQGTSSWASNAVSSSYALSATSASYALNSTTASYSLSSTSASYALNSTSASFAQTAISASFASNVPATASFAISASNADTANTATTATTATTASYVLNAVSASFAASAASAVSASFATTSVSSSFAQTSISSSFAQTAISSSFTSTAISASFASTATSASYALSSTSASFSNTSTSASYALTASYVASAGIQGSEIYSYTFLTMGA